MEYAAELLGRPYGFSGTVGKGRKIGRTMGFPTINIPAPASRMLPPNGVYFSRISIDGDIYNSISNIGVNPTVSDSNTQKTIETYIFDFERDVYGSDITVWFDHFSRGEVKFPDKEALHDQIARDCEAAREYHRKKVDTRLVSC
jgi:riboflavin kinase/FMN adenylyltransferase